MTTKDNRSKKKFRLKSFLYRLVLILIASLTLGFSVYSWNATRVVGNQLPMPLGFGTSVVLSGSMEPTLSVNDLIFVTPQDEYEVDDIVVYQKGSELIIHRIIRINDDGLIITKGDANNTADDPITLDMIKGKYSFKIPYVGFVFRMVKSLPGTLLILALVIWLMYRSRKKERKSGEEELDAIAEEIRRLRELQNAEEPQSSENKTNDANESKDDTAADDSIPAIDYESDENAAVDSQDEDQPVPSDPDTADGSVADPVSDILKSPNSQHLDLNELSEIIESLDDES